MRNAGSGFCKLPLKTTEKDKKEVTEGAAVAKGIGVNAAGGLFLSELDGIFASTYPSFPDGHIKISVMDQGILCLACQITTAIK